MARLLQQSEAKKLGLPGRTSLEPVSGAIGSKVTFRLVRLPFATIVGIMLAVSGGDVFAEPGEA